MPQIPTSPTPRPGFPALRIAPASRVEPPVSFEAVRGDEKGPDADRLRLAIMDVRLEVFVGEQAVAFVEEIDARDEAPTTIHVLARGADSVPLGTGRILLEPDRPGQVHLGRLAVRKVARGSGLGARLVAALESMALGHAAAPLDEEAARAAGLAPGRPAVTVILSAQEQAMGFYERCGYRPTGGPRYLDAGIWHRDMARTLSAPGA